MKIIVTIFYRDDKQEDFECVDNPNVSDWITLYLVNLERIIIPKEAVQKINIKVK